MNAEMILARAERSLEEGNVEDAVELLAEFAEARACEPRVPAGIDKRFDWLYDTAMEMLDL